MWPRCNAWTAVILGTVFVATNAVGVSSSRTVFGKGATAQSPPSVLPQPVPHTPPPAPLQPSPPLTQSIGNFQTSVNQQNLQSVLNAIELRLRSLDNIYGVRYGASGGVASRATVGIGWDALEARLSRLESTYDRRLEIIAESFAQKHSAILHKVEMIYDRLLYMESGQNKVQVTTTKTSEKQTSIADRIDSVAKAVTRIEQQQIKANGTLYALEQRLQAVAVSIESMGMPSIVATEGSCSLNSSDIMNEIEGAVTTLREHIDRKADIVINKASNSYNDMWRHVISTESLVKATLTMANATKQQLEEIISGDPSSAATLTSPSRTFMRNRSTSPSQIDNSRLEGLVDDLAKHITHNMDLLDRHSEERFREIQNSGEAYHEGCHRVQTEFEDRITKVLNRLLDVFGEKTDATNKGLIALKELLKSHDNHVTTIVSRTITKVVHNASDISGERDKALQKMIKEMFLNASQDSRQIQLAIEQGFNTTNSDSGSHPELIATINEMEAAVKGLREHLDCYNNSCTLHTLLKNMSSELEKTFLSSCGRGGSFSEKYNTSYEEAWAFILGKKNSTELDTGTEEPVEETSESTDESQPSGVDAKWTPLDPAPLEEDYNNGDDDVHYR